MMTHEKERKCLRLRAFSHDDILKEHSVGFALKRKLSRRGTRSGVMERVEANASIRVVPRV